MWNKLLERLETVFEPQIDSSQFVTHYQPALIYKKMKEPIRYAFDIEEQTQLNNHIVKNTYNQKLDIHFLNKSNEGYKFNIETSKNEFILDNSLISQGKFLKDLAPLTSQLEVMVNEKGTIKSVNHKDILKKWEQLKNVLLERYQGNQAHAYIYGIDAKVNNEALFLEDLKQARLLGLFFGGYQAAHEKDKPRDCKISNLIHCLPVTFIEQVKDIEDDEAKQEKHIYVSGSMHPIAEETKVRIQKYFTFFEVGKNELFVSNYKRKAVLDLQTGFPKTMSLNIELTNKEGYVREQHYNLKQISNG